MRRLALLVWLTALQPAGAAGVKLPPEVKAQPGRLVRLQAECAGTVRWAVCSEAADLIPFPDPGHVAIFSANAPGRYLVLAWTAEGEKPSEAARCVVVVGGAPPPGPGPQPPPGPDPHPDDPLAAEFQKLYDADPAPTKRADLAQLAAVYELAPGFVDAPGVATAYDLMAKLTAAVGSVLPPGSLVAVRKKIAEVLAAELPTDAQAELTPAVKGKAKAAFARVAAALKGVRP